MRKLLVLMFCCGSSVAFGHPGGEAFIERAVSQHGLAETEVRVLLEDAKYQQAIIDAISRPAEAKPWFKYRSIFVTEKRIADGLEFWQANADLIAAVANNFAVDEAVIVAIIGVETSYGRITGSHRTIDALVTLAFYYPDNLSSDRSGFFSSELMHFLQLANEEGLPAAEVSGSYAGAMGMGQFIPSSYRAYAVDFDKDGRRDLWRSTPDAVASVANYLHRHGWQAGKAVTQRVRASEGAAFDQISKRNFKPTLSVSEWQEQGFKSTIELSPDLLAAVFRLREKDRSTYWFGFKNFYVITRYNRSPKYAMAVFELSLAIAKGMAAEELELKQ